MFVSFSELFYLTLFSLVLQNYTSLVKKAKANMFIFRILSLRTVHDYAVAVHAAIYNVMHTLAKLTTISALNASQANLCYTILVDYLS